MSIGSPITTRLPNRYSHEQLIPQTKQSRKIRKPSGRITRRRHRSTDNIDPIATASNSTDRGRRSHKETTPEEAASRSGGGGDGALATRLSCACLASLVCSRSAAADGVWSQVLRGYTIGRHVGLFGPEWHVMTAGLKFSICGLVQLQLQCFTI